MSTFSMRNANHNVPSSGKAGSVTVRVNTPPAELRRLAGASGFRDMLDDGADKILAGVTSVSEVLRSAGARRE